MASLSEKILARSTKGVTFLMMGQLFSKLVSFIVNSLLVRFLSPRIFGITSFLDFLSSTVLFFSREAIRLATLRIKATGSENETRPISNDEIDHENHPAVLQSVVNFAYIPICISIPLSLILWKWQYSNLNEYFIELPFFRLSVSLVFLSITIELLSEPFYVVNQFMLNYKLRSQVEGAGVTVSCVTNFIVIYWYENWVNGSGEMLHDSRKQEGIAILAFALGNVLKSVTFFFMYLFDYLRRSLGPKKQFSMILTKIYLPERSYSYYFQPDILRHFKKVYFQLCFKHLLTEGDKLIINSLCTIEEQGIYSLLSNYGSLLTRLLFAPIEESLLMFLTRLLANKSSNNLKLAIEVFLNLVKFYIYITIIIVIFGPMNSSFLLKFLVGSRWSSTNVLETIRFYCFYLPFLAMNGIAEAFFISVATGDQILHHSYFMMVFSGIFLSSCWLFVGHLKLSLEGLILSNMINMSLRIIFCAWFIRKFYNKLDFYNAKKLLTISTDFSNVKKIGTISIFVAILDWYVIGYVQSFQQLISNVILAGALTGLMIYGERDLLMRFIRKENHVNIAKKS
ncbi:HFR013Wp [Eremothecium sinecaudum]|uniref:Man(5)GlcNAc(2)-PP-dolichol translocation protein RFT1 n=1 Tax=Eremothecium sinecaudum TaxID=45286 RepID=A0A109UZQ2_9SACH|nr:HFR013Wp [Eremothecium sinecaudum]AMD21868.1 HFR013Wp [Eremothecium sinecaudum]